MKEKINFNPIKITLSLLFLFINVISAQAQVTKQSSTEITLPDAARFSYRSSGVISKQDFLTRNSLTLVEPYDTIFQVASFRLTRIRKGTTPVEVENIKNGELLDSMRALISSSRPGDKFYFEYIKCTDKNGAVLTLKALTFVID